MAVLRKENSARNSGFKAALEERQLRGQNRKQPIPTWASAQRRFRPFADAWSNRQSRPWAVIRGRPLMVDARNRAVVKRQYVADHIRVN